MPASSTDRFKVLFDHASDAHFIFDETGITDCNDAAVALLEHNSKTQLLAIHPAALSPEFQPDGRLSIEKSREMDAIARSKGWHRFEWVHQKAGGETFPVEVTLNSVEIDEKPAFIAVWHDLTDIKTKEESLKRYKTEMRAELEAAALIQGSLLPQKSPLLKGVRTSWLYEPCDELGGDSLNVFTLDEYHVGFYVLDVAGHGIRAALLSVAASHFLSPYSEYSFLRSNSAILCPHEVLGRLNEQLSSQPAFNQFLTLAYGIVDIRTDEFSYASAGHTPIIHFSEGRANFLRGGGLPIGILSGEAYSLERIPLKKGDRIFIYSDGVTEARTSKGDLFGEKRLCAVLESVKKEPLDRALSKTFSAIQNDMPPRRLLDDVAMLGVELKS